MQNCGSLHVFYAAKSYSWVNSTVVAVIWCRSYLDSVSEVVSDWLFWSRETNYTWMLTFSPGYMGIAVHNKGWWKHSRGIGHCAFFCLFTTRLGCRTTVRVMIKCPPLCPRRHLHCLLSNISPLFLLLLLFGIYFYYYCWSLSAYLSTFTTGQHIFLLSLLVSISFYYRVIFLTGSAQ